MRIVRRIKVAAVCAGLVIGPVAAAFGQANQPQATDPNGQAAGGANQPPVANAPASPANPNPGANGANPLATVTNPANSGPNQSGANDLTTANPYAYGGLSQTPWFANPATRQELGLDNRRFNQLNQAYSATWNQYNQRVGSLDGRLTPDRFSQQQQELDAEFHRTLSQSADSAFTDPAARTRFDQLSVQSRGYGAFVDPTVQQRLNLTPTQIQQLYDYNRDWNQRFRTLEVQYPNNPAAMRNVFNSYEQSFQRNLDSTLTPEQHTTWQQIAGSRFSFPPEHYFNNASTTSYDPFNSAFDE